MKLAYVNKNPWLSNMPATVFSTLNTYGFAENGLESHLFMKENEYPLDITYSEYFGIKQLDNFQVHTFSDRLFSFKSNEFFYNRVKKELTKYPFELIITRDPGFLPYLIKIRNKTKAKAFYQSHNFFLDLSHQEDQEKLNTNKFHKREKKFINKLDGLLTLNNPQKELYSKYTSIPIFAGKPGLKSLAPPIDNFDKRIIFYSGSFQIKKGLSDLLDAYSSLEIDAKLVLAGGRNEEEISAIKDYISSRRIDKEIEITGWLSYAELIKNLQTATIGVIPLQDIFYNRYLTAPSKLFDYLSHGIPIVASDMPSIRDLVKENQNCLFYPAGENNKLALLITSLLENKELYLQMQNNNIELAKEYLWKNSAKKMLEFMLSV